MGNKILKQAAKFLHDQKNNKRWLKIVLCLAVIVALGTAAMLRMYGQAMTHKVKVLNCPLTLHTHDEECYNDEGELICGLADYVVHVHNDDCWDEKGNLVCQLPEIEPHEHDETCYEEQKVLICELEETPGHEHTEECYDKDGELICGLEEGEGGHTHDESCYEMQKVLTCGKLELHTHDEELCYEGEGEERKLICKIPVLEEHIHSGDCFETVELTQEEIEEQIKDAVQEQASKEDASSENTGDEDAQVTDNTENGENAGTEAEEQLFEKTYEDKSVRVTARYSEKANIPEEAELKVEQVTAESDPENYEKTQQEALEAVGGEAQDEDAAPVLVYDIGFFVEGKKVEPEAPVTVKIQFLDENGLPKGSPVSVVHFAEEGVETLGGSEINEDGEMEFETGSFSGFAIISNEDYGIATVANVDDSTDLHNYVVEQKLSKNGVDVQEGGEVVVGDNYKYTVKFKPKDGESFQAEMHYDLGSNVKCAPCKDKPLYKGNVKVGTYTLTEDGQVTVHFDESFLETNENQELEMTFDMLVTDTKDGDGREYPWTGHVEKEYQVKDDVDLNVEKTASYFSTSSKTITYKVEATVTSGMLKNGWLEDNIITPGAGSYRDGSAKLRILDADGKDITSQFHGLPSVEKTETGWKVEGLPDLVEGQKVVIEYTVDVSDAVMNGTITSVDNEVTFDGKTSTGQDVPPATDKEEMNTLQKQLQKEGEIGDDGTINWTVQVGNGLMDPRMGADGKLHDLEIEDTLRKKNGKIGQEFVEEDWTVYVVDGDGKILETHTIPWADMDHSHVTNPEEPRVTYKIPSTWKLPEGAHFEVHYRTKYDLNEQPGEGYYNEVETKIKDVTITEHDTVPIGDDIDKKLLEDNEKDNYLTYQVVIDVPAASQMAKMGNDDDDHTGLSYYYVRDELEFDTMYLYQEPSEYSTKYYTKNVPQDVTIDVKGANGHSIVFDNYPYSAFNGIGDAGRNTFQIVETSEGSGTTGRDLREFLIYFNTAAYGTQPDGKLDHHDSIWDIDYPTTMTITYKIPYDTEIVDAEGKTIYRKDSTGEFTEEPLTVGDLLNMGGRLCNNAIAQRRGTTVEKEVVYQKVTKDEDLIKTNRKLEDGVIEYRVRFKSGDGGTSSPIIPNELRDQVWFQDSFDGRLEYVEGSLKVEEHDLRDEGGGRLQAVYIYKGEKSPYQNNGEDKNGEIKVDLGNKSKDPWERTYALSTSEDYDGKPRPLYRELDENDHEFIFIYQLCLKEEFRETGEDQLNINNTATLEWPDNSLTDDSTVNIPAEHIEKKAEIKDGIVYYEIEVNPYAIDLVDMVVDEDGTEYNPQSYELIDTMSDNQELTEKETDLPSNPAVYIVDDENNEIPLERVLSAAYVKEGSNSYYLDKHPEGRNGMSITLPDKAHLIIRYAVEVTDKSGKVPITNEAKLAASVKIADSTKSEFDVGGSSGEVKGTKTAKLIKYKTGEKTQLPDAYFAFYSEQSPGVDPNSDSNIPEGVTVEPSIQVEKDGKNVTLYYQKVYKTDENGEITGISAMENEDGTGLYALVEIQSPNGYILSNEPIFFQYAAEAGVEQVYTVEYEGTGYGVSHLGEIHVLEAENPPMTYSLPKTGGMGGNWYRAGELLLIALAAVMLYGKTRNGRKTR